MSSNSNAGRLLAIGDIHGCLTALDSILDMVQPRPTDVIVGLGDFVDRGPNSRGTLDRLLELEQRCTLVPLLGNHEQMLLDAAQSAEVLANWLLFGGLETLQSYGVPRDAYTLDKLPAEHRRFLEERCRDYFETDHYQFVHAGFAPQLPLTEQPVELLRWEKLVDRGPHQSGKVTVCGHTRQISGTPLDLGHTICIDTWVYGSGWLTCMDMATRQYWQANERGETRVVG